MTAIPSGTLGLWLPELSHQLHPWELGVAGFPPESLCQELTGPPSARLWLEEATTAGAVLGVSFPNWFGQGSSPPGCWASPSGPVQGQPAGDVCSHSEEGSSKHSSILRLDPRLRKNLGHLLHPLCWDEACDRRGWGSGGLPEPELVLSFWPFLLQSVRSRWFLSG